MPNNPHHGMSNDPKPGEHRLPPSAIESNIRWGPDGKIDGGVHTVASEDVYPRHSKRQQWGMQPQAETASMHRDHAIAIPTLIASHTQHAVHSFHASVAHTSLLVPSFSTPLPSQQESSKQPETQRHCFKDAAGNQICRVISNYHHNSTDVHKDHGVNDFHNEYNDGHKDAFNGIIHGTNITSSFSQPGQETHVIGSHKEGKTIFEGHESTSQDGFRDTHEDEKNGDFEDHKEDNTYNEVDYKEASRHPTDGQGRTNVHEVSTTHEVNDVKDHNGATDSLLQGSEDWDFQLQNLKDHGRGRPAEGKVADHPMTEGNASPQETNKSSENTDVDKHASGHADHVHDEHSGTDGTYELHEEANEKDSTVIHMSGSDAIQDLYQTLENMQGAFHDPALKVEAGSSQPSSSQPRPRDEQFAIRSLSTSLGGSRHVITIDCLSKARHGGINPFLGGACIGIFVLFFVAFLSQCRKAVKYTARPKDEPCHDGMQEKEDV